MNARGQYGHRGQYRPFVGRASTVQSASGDVKLAEAYYGKQPTPWWVQVLVGGLAIGAVGLFVYNAGGLVKDQIKDMKEDARDRKRVAAWSSSKRDQYRDSGLTVDAFEDWSKTGGGLTVGEWIRATPEKGRAKQPWE